MLLHWNLKMNDEILPGRFPLGTHYTATWLRQNQTYRSSISDLVARAARIVFSKQRPKKWRSDSLRSEGCLPRSIPDYIQFRKKLYKSNTAPWFIVPRNSVHQNAGKVLYIILQINILTMVESYCSFQRHHGMWRSQRNGFPVSIYFPPGTRLLQGTHSFQIEFWRERKGRLRFLLRPRVQYTYCMCSSVFAQFKETSHWLCFYRDRDISDSEIDELNKLQGIEVVFHKDSPWMLVNVWQLLIIALVAI